MSDYKLFFEDYLSDQGKVEIPGANHVGIELDDGTIVELAPIRGERADRSPRVRLSSHDAIIIEPTSANSAQIGQAEWSRQGDLKAGRVRPSQVNPPPGGKAAAEARAALDVLMSVSRLLLGGAIHTKTVAARENLAGDIRAAVTAIGRAL